MRQTNVRTDERASERASDRLGESESSRRSPREKRYPRILSLRALSSLEIPRLPWRRDRRDRQLSEPDSEARLRKTTQRARDVIVQAARSVPLRHFDLSSFALPPSFSSFFRARIEAARRDPESRVSKSHLARESLPSLFPDDSFSRSFTAVAAGATSPFYLLARPPRRVGFLISE